MNTSKLIVVVTFVFLLFPMWGRGQQVEIYADARGNQYAAINLKDMPRNVEDRNANSDFYNEVQLFETDQTTPVKDAGDGNVYVKRITRHYTNSTNILDPDKHLSCRFILSPQSVNSDGTSPGTAGTVTWAQANGYLNAANSQRFNNPPPTASAAMTGCSAYQGKDGQDAKGTWRVPTHREGAIIIAFQKELEATKDVTAFEAFVNNNKLTYYWLATEFYGSTEAWYMSFATVATDNSLSRNSKNTRYYLRCIRDIKVE